MTTKTVTKIVNNLTNEVKVLRSLVISVIGKDNEGEYRPAFVKGVLKAARQKPTENFSNSKDFLKKLKRA